LIGTAAFFPYQQTGRHPREPVGSPHRSRAR
jgi:hypothetical protein